MKIRGYAGKILHIDLLNGAFREEILNEDLARDFIGGVGINSKLLYELVRPNTAPLSPANKLIVGVGPLVGTGFPCACRLEVAAKSPQTNLLGISGSSGDFSIGLKRSGYDHLIVHEKSRGHVYLFLEDGRAQIRPADGIWGLDTIETVKALRKEHGDDIHVLCIGPAGENLVKIASIMTDGLPGLSAVARTGLGAVMGSKNLKAIVVRARGKLEIADPGRFEKVVDEARKRILRGQSTAVPGYELWRDVGTIFFLDPLEKAFQNASKNFQELTTGTSEVIGVEAFKQLKEGIVPCHGCPIACKQLIKVKSGKYSGLELVGLDIAAPKYLGGCLDILQIEEVAKGNDLVNRLGMDMFSASLVAQFAIELFERGIIGLDDTAGLKLEWGNASSFHQLLELISSRKAIGDLLAEGVAKAAKAIGKESERFAVTIKDLEVTNWEPRVSFNTWNFGPLTNPRGGCLSKAKCPVFMFTEESIPLLRSWLETVGVPPEAIRRIVAEKVNVPRLTKWVEDYNTSLDCLGVCLFASWAGDFGWEILSNAYEAATGFALSQKELITAAERVWNLQRLFNMREGVRREDDSYPERLLTDPAKTATGKLFAPIPQSEVEKMLDGYYRERRWDKEGIPEQPID
jgi:aldehyde:ferredoxin oxidoreductase